MSLFSPVDLDFDSHPKTIELKRILGESLADAYPQRLWRWCAKFCRSGRPPRANVETICGWSGAPGVLLEALFAVRFLERRTGRIRNWSKHSAYFARNQAGNHPENADGNQGCNQSGNHRVVQIREAVRRCRERKKKALEAVNAAAPAVGTADQKPVIGFAPMVNVITPSVEVIQNSATSNPSPPTPACAGASKAKAELESMHACMQHAPIADSQPAGPQEQATLPSFPPPVPEKTKSTRTRKKPEGEYLPEDYAFVQMFRQDWEDTLEKPGKMLGLPITPKELEAAKGFRLEGWKPEQLIAHQRLYLNDKPRPPRFPGDRPWPGWVKKVLSVHDWFRFRTQIQAQIDRREIDRDGER